MFGNTCVIGGEQYRSPLGDDGCDGCSSQAQSADLLAIEILHDSSCTAPYRRMPSKNAAFRYRFRTMRTIPGGASLRTGRSLKALSLLTHDRAKYSSLTCFRLSQLGTSVDTVSTLSGQSQEVDRHRLKDAERSRYDLEVSCTRNRTTEAVLPYSSDPRKPNGQHPLLRRRSE